MSRRRSVAAMGLAGVVAALVVAVGVARSVPQEPSVAYGVAQGEAAKISASVCASCHGDNLAGGRSSSLIDDAWVYGGSDEDLAASIRDGRPGTLMPPFKATLDERQIRSLVVLIREYAEKAKVEGTKLPDVPFDAVRTSERHKFKLEEVVGGLDTPWALEFLPDGRILLTERPGRLRIFDPGKGLGAPITGIPKVWVQQDGGLLDVALHPDYAKNGWIYLGYSVQGKGQVSATEVVRGRIKDGAWVDQEFVYRPAPAVFRPGNDHYGIRFLFDPKGHLFYSIGDRGKPDDSQLLSESAGKIHRVLDDGSAPKDNPFVGREGTLATVWSYGHRNPQGLAFHPVTGELWSAEHGPRGGDELNLVLPGRNYGWPVATFGINYDGTPVSDKTSAPGMDSPVAQWTPSIAACAIAFYTGDRFPGWKNDLFVTGLVGKQLRRLVIDKGQVTHQEVLFRGLGRVRDVVDGPDGYLYVAINNPGVIARIVPAD